MSNYLEIEKIIAVHHFLTMSSDQIADAVGESYFNLEGDAELYTVESDESEEGVLLSWRGSPEATMSDWRVIIVTKAHKPRTYHVHKRILGSGSRSSKYFTMLFGHTKTTPSKYLKRKDIVSNSSSTKIELDERDARNIPDLLDYMYAGASMASLSCGGTVSTAASSTLSSMPSMQMQSMRSCSLVEDETSICLGENINTNNAVSLRHLSRLFGCEALTLAINKFIQRDLSFKTGPIYYKHAHEYKDDRLTVAAKRLCTEHFEEISVKSLLRLPLDLLKELIGTLKCSELKGTNTSLVLSEVVYLYLEHHPQYISAANLLDLTDPLTMPKIGPEPAIGFTALVKDLDPKDTRIHWEKLANLCKRCADSVVGEFGWREFSVQSALEEYLDAACHNRRSQTDSLLFATSFASALQQAQTDHARVLNRHDGLEKMVVELKKSVGQLERGNKSKDEHLEAQKQALGESKRQVVYLKKKLSEAKSKK